MKIQQNIWEQDSSWEVFGDEKSLNPQLVIFFGNKDALEDGKRFEELRALYPDAILVGGTTAGEIIGEEVLDDSVVATAIEFEKTRLELKTVLVTDFMDSFEAGQSLARQFDPEGLKTLFVLSDGHLVNGSNLVQGLVTVLGKDIIITGGLAGDGPNFQETLVSANTPPESGRIAVVGLYGQNIKVGHGSVGGWDPFGPERIITKSEANVLYELDGKPALELYKTYLGEEAENLPGSALLFPLTIRQKDQKGTGTVRTILSVNEEENSMTFAGDMPEGNVTQLMMANFDHLVDGAAEAALKAKDQQETETLGDHLAIMISCVGRKIVLGQRTADEVEAVTEILSDIVGEGVGQMGFYSYGEISPHVETGSCELHNQTMTITYLAEQV
ncbi:MAG: FIST N-terminal domain-containing protein [Bacteroidota bacterium]